MTLKEFVARATAIYVKHNMDLSGRYNDRGCIEPCCYPSRDDEDAGITQMEKLWEETGVKQSLYMYPGDYDSIKSLTKRLERLLCEHVFVLKGASSMTSSGTLDLYECIHCAQGKYTQTGMKP